MQFKTPGVYVRDLTPPVPFVPVIETALPAFIGYTEKAVGNDGEDLRFQPTRVQDITEFNTFFGGAFQPESYRVAFDSQQDNAVISVTGSPQYFLYECLQHFYENGGLDCVIISVGSYADQIDIGEAGTQDAYGLLHGLAALEKIDEPSLILFPDAVAMKNPDGSGDAISLGALQQAALQQCAVRKDRFLIADIMDLGDEDTTINTFRDRLGTSNLAFGAAYYPWLYRDFDHTFRFRELRLYDIREPGADPIGGDGYKTLSSDADSDIARNHQKWVKDVVEVELSLDQMVEAVGIEGVGPEELRQLEQSVAGSLKVLRDASGEEYPTSLDHVLTLLRNIALAFAKLDYSVILPLQSILDRLRIERELIHPISKLIALELHPTIRAQYTSPRTEDEVRVLYSDLLDSRWFVETTVESTTGAALIEMLKEIGDALAGSIVRLYTDTDVLGKSREATLFSRHPFFSGVAEAVSLARKKIPPSGAVAGLYGVVDRTEGVWKAPANIALNDTLGPTVVIDDQAQEPLNVHFTGKSINAIRPFRGRGIRIWGARTLNGNSLDWRYVSVRRYFNFIEEFTKKLAEPFVFESNDENTWLQIRSLIENFLSVQWTRGALVGAVAGEAYFVRIGLGETMLEIDVLEGRMIIEIGLAVVRPAEFIVIRYICRMEQN